MKAIRLHARGGPEAFAYEEAPQPRPGEGEVLVRVHAEAVTPTELVWVPTWTTPRCEPRRFPIIRRVSCTSYLKDEWRST